MRETKSKQDSMTQLSQIVSGEHSAGAKAWRKRRHLLDTSDLSKEEIACFLAVAEACRHNHLQEQAPLAVLHGKTIAHVFYENSTRTRSSFEIAARRLGAEVLNLDTKVSSVTKGETLVDTARQLLWMGVAAIVQRHHSSGSADLLVNHVGADVHILNAGDGWHAHPTQAMLDLLTMTGIRADLNQAKVTILGDVTHSRVARSNIWLLQKLGANVHVVGPPTLIPPGLEDLDVTVHTSIQPALQDADFVIALRLQLERQKQGMIPSIGEYKKLYRLDHERLKVAKPTVRVLHPGPVNRGIEITDGLVDDAQISLVSTQVTNGVATRMAILYLLLAGAQ